MNRRSRPAGRWFFLLCSVTVLVLSWTVQPEAAREWVRVKLAALSGSRAPGVASGLDDGSALSLPEKPPLESKKITIYLPSRGSPGMLEAVDASIGAASTPKELAVEALGLLQAPPAEANRKPAVPAGTRVQAVFLQGTRMIVDLSSEFLSTPPGSVSEARQQLYAVVNTLTSLPFAEEVRFLVGDEERTTFFDVLDLTAVYRFNAELVANRSPQ